MKICTLLIPSFGTLSDVFALHFSLKYLYCSFYMIDGHKLTICYWVQCCGRPCKCYSSWSPSFGIDGHGFPEHYNQGEEKRLWTTSLYFSPRSLQPIFLIWNCDTFEYQSELHGWTLKTKPLGFPSVTPRRFTPGMLPRLSVLRCP